MLNLINKNYSQYHVLRESQTLCSGTIKLAQTDITNARFEFEFPEDLDTLKREGTR